MDLGKGVGLEHRVGVAAGDLDAMPDVGRRVVLAHRTQPLAQARPLPQRGQALLVDHVVERRLAGQRDRDDPPVARVDAGEQPQFLDRRGTQVLGLVHDDHDVTPGQVLLEEVRAQLVEQLHLPVAVVGDAELRQQALQQLDVGEGRVRKPRDDVIRAQLLERRIEHGGLAGADLARDHDEAVVVHQREAHVGHGARVLVRQVKESRVRREVERPTRQVEEFLVHPALFPAPRPARPLERK